MPVLSQEQQWLRSLVAQVNGRPRFRAEGLVADLIGLTIIADGPPATVGEVCTIQRYDGGPPLLAQVVGFRGGQTLLMPLGQMAGLRPGCRVSASGHTLSIRIGRGALGRVLNAFGEPIDGRGALGRTVLRHVESRPPGPLERQRVLEPMYFGVRALDGLLTCGKGQRLGIFAGAGVGKSTLLGMMARNTTADVNVIALIGERGREVKDFLEVHLANGLARSVVVVATSDEPALVRITAGLTATAIAEYFRDLGLDVLLMMDSVTRLARAQREVGLAAGETPTTRGFPPSLHVVLPRLLERAGAGRHGTITGIYSVLVEGDDMQEPVADTISAILDGHIVLNRDLANEAHYPAVDVGASVSRLMGQVTDPQHAQAATRLRALLAARQEAVDLISVGAYQPGTRPLVDRALRYWDRILAFLRQREDEYASAEECRQALLTLVRDIGGD